jgi:Flp pilus assembly protein TadG
MTLSPARRKRGVATVEMAIVAPLLIFLLFAIVEFGVLMRDIISVHEAAREGARAAVVGATLSTAKARAVSAALPLEVSPDDVDVESRSWDFDTGDWAADFAPLADGGAANPASPGDQIRVTVAYQHKILLPGLFGGWADDWTPGEKRVQAATIMRRE